MGGADVNKAAKFILLKFMQANRARLSVYPQYAFSALELSLNPVLDLTLDSSTVSRKRPIPQISDLYLPR